MKLLFDELIHHFLCTHNILSTQEAKKRKQRQTFVQYWDENNLNIMKIVLIGLLIITN